MKILFILTSLLLVNSCGSFQAKRVDAAESDEKALKITDNWMSKDTTMVVEELLNQIKTNPAYLNYKMEKGMKSPKVFVAEIQNLTADAYFQINDINDELLFRMSQTGEYTLVDEAKRDTILKEITYQNDGMVDLKEIKAIGKQAGADLIIFGNVFMRPETRKGKTIKEYAINLRLTDIERGVEVARARKNIYKYSDKNTWGF